MNAISRKQTILVVLAIGAALASVYFWNSAKHHRATFESWVNARPLDEIIDLSQPGEHTFPFEQTCRIHHGEGVYVVRPNHVDPAIEGPVLLSGLVGSITIQDEAGAEIARADINGERAGYFYDNGDIRLTGLPEFPIGSYTANINIDSEAEDISLTEVRTYAIYELCGLELLPARLNGVASAGSGLIALAAFGVLVWSWRKANSAIPAEEGIT